MNTMGNDHSEDYSQYEIAQIIEPRLEEIFELVHEEIYRMGYSDLPGGYIFTGGAVMIPGTLDLAEDVLRQNVRMTVPDYIGVREPIYTTAIGLIEFAHEHVKIQDKEMAVTSASEEQSFQAAPLPPADTKPKKDRKELREQREKENQSNQSDQPTVKSKVKNFFKVFFE